LAEAPPLAETSSLTVRYGSHMRRFIGALLVTAALVPPLTACTGRPAPSDEAVSKWVSDEASRAMPRGLAAIGLGSGTSTPDSWDAPGEGVTFGLGDTLSTVTGFEVRCYGADTMPIRFTVASATETTSIESDPVRCDKKPHTIEFDATGVSEITVGGLKTASTTGWFITALGHPTP